MSDDEFVIFFIVSLQLVFKFACHRESFLPKIFLLLKGYVSQRIANSQPFKPSCPSLLKVSKNLSNHTNSRDAGRGYGGTGSCQDP
jgi:hypothetical protein